MGKVISLIEDDSRYKLTIFAIILFTGFILWYFRILMLFGLFMNPHSPNIWFGGFKAYYNAAKLYIGGEDIWEHRILLPSFISTIVLTTCLSLL